MLPGKVDMDVERPLFTSPLVFLFVALTACGGASSGTSAAKVEKISESCEESAVHDQFLVRWKNGTTTVEHAEDREALIRDVIEPHNDEIVRAENAFRIQPPSKPTEIDVFATNPSDPLTWGQENIHASEAWQLARGEGVIVAVIDTGADLTHPQLKNQLAVNEVELHGQSGVDDDGNGYIDDVYGYDFYAKSGDVQDASVGHGTHVSGIVAAEHTSANLPKGIAPGAKILPLTFIGKNGGYTPDAVLAIDYAVSRGARVINASWGGQLCSAMLRQQIAALESKGVLFIAASGNGDSNGIGFDITGKDFYPAGYSFPSVLTVGAITPSNRMTGFSNYSRSLVGIMAPGSNIRSTYPLSFKKSDCGSSADSVGYCTLSGTSMAAPFVAGAAAVVLSYRPKATLAQVREALVSSVTVGDYLVTSGGRLDLRKALDRIAVLVP